MEASICQCPEDVTGFIEQGFYCLHIPGHFSSSSMKEEEWLGPVLAIGWAALSRFCVPGVSCLTPRREWMCWVLCSLPGSPAWMPPKPQLHRTRHLYQTKSKVADVAPTSKTKPALKCFFLCSLVLLVLKPAAKIKIKAGAKRLCRVQIHGYFWAWLGETFREPNLTSNASWMVVDYRPLKVFDILNYSVILSSGRQTGPLGIHPFPLAVKGDKWRAGSDRGICPRDVWSCGFIIMQPCLNIFLQL